MKKLLLILLTCTSCSFLKVQHQRATNFNHAYEKYKKEKRHLNK